MKWIFESTFKNCKINGKFINFRVPGISSLREYSQIEKNDFADDHIGQNTQEMKRMSSFAPCKNYSVGKTIESRGKKD